MSYNVGNVGAPGATPGEVIETIGEVGPTILVLQETRGTGYAREVASLASATWDSEYRYIRDASSSIAIITTGVWIDHDLLVKSSSEGDHRVLTALLAVEEMQVLVAGVHLAPIPKPRNEEGYVDLNLRNAFGIIAAELFADTPRSEAARSVIDYIETRAEAENADLVVLAGDFNTIPASRTLRLFRKQYRDTLSTRFAGNRGTYWKIKFPLKPRVDYILVSKDATVRDARVLDGRAADHLAVSATVDVTHTAALVER